MRFAPLGRKTKRGKRTVVRNAIKYGLLERQAVITHEILLKVERNLTNCLNSSTRITNL
jgi:hypothetical protein